MFPKPAISCHAEFSPVIAIATSSPTTDLFVSPKTLPMQSTYVLALSVVAIH